MANKPAKPKSSTDQASINNSLIRTMDNHNNRLNVLTKRLADNVQTHVNQAISDRLVGHDRRLDALEKVNHEPDWLHARLDNFSNQIRSLTDDVAHLKHNEVFGLPKTKTDWRGGIEPTLQDCLDWIAGRLVDSIHAVKKGER